MDELIYFRKCKELIEQELNWQPSINWKNRDFENLAEIIFAKTGTLLSTSTLKRIWKDTYSGTPQINTLHALANYLGYKNWAEFKTSLNPDEVKNPTGQPVVKISLIEKLKTYLTFSPVRIVLGVLIVFCLSLPFIKSSDNKEIKFSIKTVVPEGVPNSILFNYDVSDFEGDSLFFQPSWNKYEQKFLDPENNLITGIYYFPGVHLAKIVSQNSIIKSIKIKINSDGWVAALRYKPTDIVPVYFNKDEFTTGNSLYISPEILQKHRIDLYARDYWVSYFNVGDFNNISSDSFSFETTVSNSEKDGGLTCRYLYLYLFFEEGYFIIPFGDKGCSSKFSLTLGDFYKSGKNYDLSMFGCDMEKPVNIKVKGYNKNVNIYINDTDIFSTTYTINPGKFHGMHFFFYGSGKISDVKISDLKGNRSKIQR